MNDTPNAVRAAHSSIVAALAAAQAEMGPALKQAANLHLRSRYADLSNVTEACLPALNRHGIAVYHTYTAAAESDGAVRTVFDHDSGQKIETDVPLMIGQRTMQGLGSAITYARRYGLMMLAGLAPEDDDGHEASKAPAPRRAEQPKVPPRSDGQVPQAQPFDSAAATDQVIAALSNAKDQAALDAAWKTTTATRKSIHAADAEGYERVKQAAADRKSALTAESIGDSIPF